MGGAGERAHPLIFMCVGLSECFFWHPGILWAPSVSKCQPPVSSRDGGTQDTSIRGRMLLCSALSARFSVFYAERLAGSLYRPGLRKVLWLFTKRFELTSTLLSVDIPEAS